MVNVFGGLPQGADDVKDTVMKLLAQQQANEPTPRQPTPQEMDQLKQAAMQAAQAKGQMPGQGLPGGSAFMGQGGLAPTAAPQQTPTPAAPTPPPQPGGFKNFMTSPLWGDHDLLFNQREQQKGLSSAGDVWDALNKPQWFKPGDKPGVDAPGYVPGTGDVPTQLPAKMHPESDTFIPPGMEQEKEAPKAEAAKQDTEGDTEKNMASMLEAAKKMPAAQNPDDAMTNHFAKNVAPQARKAADELVSAGANTPEKADIMVRSKFGEDPELENAIAEAKSHYEQAKAANDKPPSVLQYIGGILMTLAGGRPEMIQAIMRPNQHQNMMREQQSGEDLLKLQLAKAHGLQQSQMLQAKQGDDSAVQRRIDAQLDMANQREAGMNKRAEASQHFNDLKETINFYRQEAEKHDVAATKSWGDSKQKHLKAAAQARQQAQPFMQMLNDEIQQKAKQMQPQQPPASSSISNPQSMAPQQGQVSQGAMRLLGMGA